MKAVGDKNQDQGREFRMRTARMMLTMSHKMTIQTAYQGRTKGPHTLFSTLPLQPTPLRLPASNLNSNFQEN